MDNTSILSLSRLSVGYRNRVILDGLNLSASECELVALIGRNGTGKSTLMRTIARLQPAISGRVAIAGRELGQYSRTELAGLLSIVSTEPAGMSHLTVRQSVSFGRFPYTNWVGKLTKQDTVFIEEAMQLTGISLLENRKLHEISDGERQRAMIARALAQDTGIILLDEPTAFLDMPNKYEAIHLLHNLTRTKRKTILFSTHDLNIALQEADKLWLLVDGAIYEGAPEDMALNHRLARVFEGSKLRFDDRKGEFNIKRTGTRPISLSGSGTACFWTEKALERLGFSVCDVPDDGHPDIVVSHGPPVSWIMYRSGWPERYNSIYELSKNLLKNDKI